MRAEGGMRILRPVRATLAALALLALSTVIAACGNTIQAQPISDNTLQQLVSFEKFPVYWLGASFHALQLASFGTDPGGAYTIQYGNCTVESASNCVSPLELISSPDNAFLPSAGIETTPTQVRGVSALAAQGGEVIELRTGPIVIDVRANSARLARAAAQEMVPVNEVGQPRGRLPSALRNTGYNRRVMEQQRPSTVKLLPPLPPKASRG